MATSRDHPNPKKRKTRRELSHNEIVEMLRDHENLGRSIKQTLAMYDISESSFHNYQKEKKERKKYLTENEVELGDGGAEKKHKRTVVRKSPVERINCALVAWAKDRNQGSSENKFKNNDLRAKAIEVRDGLLKQYRAGKLHLTKKEANDLKKFVASPGWAPKWKKRNKFRLDPMGEGAKDLLEFYTAVNFDALLTGRQDPSVWSIKGTIIGDDEGSRLAQALSRSVNCKKLALSDNQLTLCAFRSIANTLLDGNNSIVELSIHQNEAIGGEGVALISKMTHLTFLQLWDCKLGDSDAAALSEVLRSENSSIETLILTRNLIGPKGADAIGEALNTNTTLKCLSLDSNDIGKNSKVRPRAFLAMLRANRILKRLHIEKNMVGDELCHALSENQNSVLYDLQLGKNGITDEGASDLAKFLLQNDNLRAIKLTGNSIGDNGIIQLVNAIRNRACARGMTGPPVELAVSYDKLTKKGTDELHAAEMGADFVKLVDFLTHDRPARQTNFGDVSVEGIF